MSAEDKFRAANEAFVDGDLDVALHSYNEAIDLDDSQVEYYVKRAACLIKLEKYTDAIMDTKTALQLEPACLKALLRQGDASFALKDYSSALEAFRKAKELDGTNVQAKAGVSKCCTELGIDASQPLVPAEPTAPVKVQESATSALRIKHDWYQTDAHVVVSIMIKKVKAEDCSVEFTDKTLSVSITLPAGGGSEYNLELDLFGPISPSGSSYKVLGTKVEIKMLKAKPGLRWTLLEGDGLADSGTVMATPDEKVAAPASTQKRNWDKLVKDFDKEEEEEKPEGEAAMNKLFQQIYADADDDTRRAMMKSFVESKGTVLSTNWKDIGAKKTEVKPPEDTVVKTWDGKQVDPSTL